MRHLLQRQGRSADRVRPNHMDDRDDREQDGGQLPERRAARRVEIGVGQPAHGPDHHEDVDPQTPPDPHRARLRGGGSDGRGLDLMHGRVRSAYWASGGTLAHALMTAIGVAPLGAVVGRWARAAPAASVVVFSQRLLALGQVRAMIRPTLNQVARTTARD